MSEKKENKDSRLNTDTEKEKDPNWLKKEIFDYIKMIITVAVIVFVVNGLLIINAKIPSASMESTIMTGDRVFGFRLSYGINIHTLGIDYSVKMRDPERYDIIIFKYPDDESQLFIKRIVGLPGETIHIKDGKVYINDSTEPLDDSFVNEPDKLRIEDLTFEIPEDSYFVMGDNRNNSNDSRYWNNHYVNFDQIVGKAIVRYFPSIKFLGYKAPES